MCAFCHTLGYRHISAMQLCSLFWVFLIFPPFFSVPRATVVCIYIAGSGMSSLVSEHVSPALAPSLCAGGVDHNPDLVVLYWKLSQCLSLLSIAVNKTLTKNILHFRVTVNH